MNERHEQSTMPSQKRKVIYNLAVNFRIACITTIFTILFLLLSTICIKLCNRSARFGLIKEPFQHVPSASLPKKCVSGDENNVVLIDTDASLVATRKGLPKGNDLIAIPPLFLEIGTLVLVQSVGIPLISKFLMKLFGRIKLLRFHRVLPKAIGPTMHRMWKNLRGLYHKTSASKITTRTKQVAHQVLHQNENEDDENNVTSRRSH